ncbi:MAG: hypothetical protein FJ299_00855 [Planctomycetes bacterium]|nr:hypothetical protein [Planctomycetota bacterium]
MLDSLRGWIVLLAATSFLAGVAAGVIFGLEVAPAPPERGPFDEYQARLGRAFQLDREQQRVLALRLDQYRREIEAVQSKYMPGMEAELVKAGLGCRDYIRDRVLPPAERKRFDTLVQTGQLPEPTF